MARFAVLLSFLLLWLPQAVQSFAVPTPVVEAWDSYNAALVASPLVVKSVTASVILGAADLSGQAIESARAEDDGESTIDWARAARFAIFGLVLQAVRKTKAFDVRELFDDSCEPTLTIRFVDHLFFGIDFLIHYSPGTTFITYSSTAKSHQPRSPSHRPTASRS